MNNGFREVFSQKFDDYKIEGEVIFPTEEPHNMATLFVKILWTIFGVSKDQNKISNML